MRYIKHINEYNSKSYQEISDHEVSILRELPRENFSDQEFRILMADNLIINPEKIKIGYGSVDDPYRLSTYTINKRLVKNLDAGNIFKLKDEWYLVIILSAYRSSSEYKMRRYKCDQFSGVLDLIDDLKNGKISN